MAGGGEEAEQVGRVMSESKATLSAVFWPLGVLDQPALHSSGMSHSSSYCPRCLICKVDATSFRTLKGKVPEG